MVCPQRLQKQPAFYRLLFVVYLTVVLLVASPWVSAKEKPKPKPQEWQINGILAALEDAYPEVQGASLRRLDEYDTKALQDSPKRTEELAQKAATLFKNSKQDSYVRDEAVGALGNLGNAAKPYTPDLADLLKDKTESYSSRLNTAVALSNLGDAAKPYIPDILSLLKGRPKDDTTDGAADALSNLGNAATPYVLDLANLLKDKTQNSDSRVGAAIALSKLGNVAKPCIPDILNLLKDKTKDSQERIKMGEALGNFGEAAKPFIPDIANILRYFKQDPETRIRAAQALSNFGHLAKPYVLDIANFLRDKKQDIPYRVDAAIALCNLGDLAKPYVKDILSFLQEKELDVRSRLQIVAALKEHDLANSSIQNVITLLKDKNSSNNDRVNVATALSELGEAAKPYTQDFVNLLKDRSSLPFIRIQAAIALSGLGDSAKPYTRDILDLFEDKAAFRITYDNMHRLRVAEALGKITQLDLGSSLIVFNRIYYVNQNELPQWRFLTYFLSGGTNEIKTLLKWLGLPDSKNISTQLIHAEAKQLLELFDKVWKLSQNLPRFRNALAQQIADVAKMGKWETGDIPLLAKHYQNLSTANSNNADSVKEAMNRLTVWQWFNKARNTIAIHLSFWLALIFAYPKFPQVQAIFFWNPWVRRILGVGYVGFLLTWVPFLRRKLFEPFKFSLLADSGVDRFNPAAYFPQSDVKPLDATAGVAIATAIPAIKGQIVLEGDSGLGKSMFLRHLVEQSPRTVVFLPARKCEQGVIEAIQTKLHGQAQDAEFLKNLIYSGAIDLCIDGLNEVTADTRAKITQFVESYFKGNIIMTTQPLEWLPPSTAKIYQLQPLRSDQIQEFLLSRSAIVAPDLADKRDLRKSTDIRPPTPNSGGARNQSPPELEDLGSDDKYTHDCCTYLNEVLNDRQPPEELAAIQRTLSNPMDLTVVAQMIALGKQPNLLRLQEQQYNLMAAEYQKAWNQDFPLKKFSEAVYQLRLNDEKALPADEFYQELVSMEDEKYKMVVSRQWKDSKGEAQHEWYFRHDKIMEFFIVQTFLGDSAEAQNRLLDHMGDPRFRGVYFLLATLLPLADAQDLRERLIQYAADTKDHTVSDTFVQLLRSR